MKKLALTFVILIALIAVGSPLSRKPTSRATAYPHDVHETEPFHRSEVGDTLVRACGNCHSNQTNLPWYGYVAPISWWIQSHVQEGRQALNFSEWRDYSAQRRRDDMESICGVISNGRMPPASYKALHPESRLTAKEKKAICAWAVDETKLDK
jgi:Haem-binding domain